ncbi:glycosyltransferase family 4 protein [Niabella drilacis]|uniref:Glycosyltransferase involved in cell wall bisynthesis n=1 Tax=Niabella drilacis (strain DSM 25811 / CCM 8410 / CCUG 62505 / LMG 26954 / E90) TaxID=1285928 RepID=A0A1G6ZG04_NIADE|nr:glycosyltransferase family 4 protein [Niabella drilacis]SDE01293.1 Glycosyltransferase involved in cell wall bisynthesis [Niabella drilacis]
MIKIASLVPYKIVPPVTGGEKAVYYFWKHLAAGSALTCFTVVENEPLSALYSTAPVLGSSRNKFRYLNPLLFFRLRRLLREQGIRYLVLEHPYFGWLGILLQRFAGIKLIVRSHNIEGLRFRDLKKWWWKLLSCYEKQVHRLADLSFFITPEDRDFALQYYSLLPEKCMVVPYGIELVPVAAEARREAKRTLCNELGIDTDTRLILFNGTLSYGPNLDAVTAILRSINPLLRQQFSGAYRILVCGKGLPDALVQEMKAQEQKDILYRGFVKDIQLYFSAADLFINPVAEGGGIKTKLVEALGSNTPAVSYQKGAFGVPQEVAGTQLRVVADRDDRQFAAEMVAVLEQENGVIPPVFYDYFRWDKIARRAMDTIEKINT